MVPCWSPSCKSLKCQCKRGGKARQGSRLSPKGMESFVTSLQRRQGFRGTPRKQELCSCFQVCSQELSFIAKNGECWLHYRHMKGKAKSYFFFLQARLLVLKNNLFLFRRQHESGSENSHLMCFKHANGCFIIGMILACSSCDQFETRSYKEFYSK